jgi:ADP-ribose pyrophosphatase YjhB (NUDIX family)
MERRKALLMHHGSKKIKWIPEVTYTIIKKYIPIPCVDVFIEDPKSGFLWIKRNMPPQFHQWAPIGGRILKFESPEIACQRIAKKEMGLNIDVKEFIGFTEFRDKNHFISLNFRAMLLSHKDEIKINKKEVAEYIFNYDMPLGTANQYIDIYQQLRRKIYEKSTNQRT